MSVRAANGLLLELEALGVNVTVHDGQVELEGPGPTISNQLRMRVAELKPTILEVLAAKDIPSADNTNDSHVAAVLHGVSSKQIPSTTDGSTLFGVEPNGTDVTATSLPNTGDGSESEVPPPLVIRFAGNDQGVERERGIVAAPRGMISIHPDGTVSTWSVGGSPTEPVAAFEAAIASGRILSFSPSLDEPRWRQLRGPDVEWIDIKALTRLVGLPSTPSGLANIVLNAEVPNAANVRNSLHRYVQASKEGATRTEIAEARVEATIARKSWPTLSILDQIEPEVRRVDMAINNRGFRIDTALANGITVIEHQLTQQAKRAAAPASTLYRSSVRLQQALADAGISVTDVTRGNLLPLLDDADLPDDLRLAVSARLAINGIAGHKARSAIRFASHLDSRVRHALVYCGAFTGRWSGRGFQPHNLPHGATLRNHYVLTHAIKATVRPDLYILQQMADCSGTDIHGVLTALVRACICASHGALLAFADYTSIEPRILFWLAGDDAALFRFRSEADVYLAVLGDVLGLSPADVPPELRALGKAMVLGCGYGMGGERFEEYAETLGFDWARTNLSAKQAVENWRSAHTSVTGKIGSTETGRPVRFGGLWHRLEWAAKDALDGTPTDVGPVRWERYGSHLICWLPSGRPLVYRNAKIERVDNRWGKEEDVITYDHGGGRVSTYGGKLTENVVQAISRDVLAAALVRLDLRGYPVVLHVHDEIVAEVRAGQQLAEMIEIMCEPPSWAPELFFRAKGEVGARYIKIKE
jgi:DNA polymerase